MIEEYYLHSPAERAPLRIGLLIDSTTLPRWAAAIVDGIDRCDYADICWIGVNAQAIGPAKPLGSRWVRRAKLLLDPRRRRYLLWELYQKLDRRRWPLSPEEDPFTPCDLGERFASTPRLDLKPKVRGFTHRFRDDDVSCIRAERLDVILRFGFNIIRGEILDTARCGVWSYHHGDNDLYRGGPPAFWELVEDAAVTGVLLQVLSDELDAGVVLAKAHVATAPVPSWSRNRIEQYWAGVPLAAEKLSELHRFGWDYVRAKAVPNRFQGRRKIYRRPTNLETTSFAVRRFAPIFLRRLTSSRDLRSLWSLAARESDEMLDPASEVGVPPSFRPIASPPEAFYADPCPIVKDGRTWIFFEEYLWAEERGLISCAEWLGEQGLGPVQRVLDLPYHLSYPFVFEHQGEAYMVPESAKNETVDLYRAVDFPSRWEKLKTLASGFRALDTTVWREDGLWWFFVTTHGPQDSRYRLLLFYSETLTGEWIRHPCSPISRDVRTARCAGPIFLDQGRRIRPAQDCSRRYGGAIRFQQILRLTPDEYEEISLGGLSPRELGGVDSTHTYSRAGTLELIDEARPGRKPG